MTPALCLFENGVCLYCGSSDSIASECRGLSLLIGNKPTEDAVVVQQVSATAEPKNASWGTISQTVTHGPGTELSKLLKRIGIEPTPTCACRAKAQQMDAWGCDECSKPERIDEVVAVMRDEAAARGLPFLDVAGRLLVRRAISNARRNA